MILVVDFKIVKEHFDQVKCHLKDISFSLSKAVVEDRELENELLFHVRIIEAQCENIRANIGHSKEYIRVLDNLKSFEIA